MSEAITKALQMAIRQNECDMLMTGDELRIARATLSQPERHLTVTTTESGEAVMVSWQDDEHRILEVVWERKEPAAQPAVPVVPDDHPLMVFAKECRLGAYMDHEVIQEAGKAIAASQQKGGQ